MGQNIAKNVNQVNECFVLESQIDLQEIVQPPKKRVSASMRQHMDNLELEISEHSDSQSHCASGDEYCEEVLNLEDMLEDQNSVKDVSFLELNEVKHASMVTFASESDSLNLNLKTQSSSDGAQASD